MNLDIDKRYSLYPATIVLHLIHSNESYNNLWVSKYSDTEMQASNYFKDVNCGCSPVLLATYKRNRFPIDIMTVNFINENPDCIDFDEFCNEYAERDIAGHVFSIPEGEGHFKDFVANLQTKRYKFKHFETLKSDDRVLITFF